MAQPWYLKAWRKKRGYTQDQLAERAGLSKPFISQLESGKKQYTQQTLEALAAALGTTPGALVTVDPDRDPDGLWEELQRLSADDRARGVAVIRALKAAS